MLDIFATTEEEGASHRGGVTEGQENNTNTRERTESRTRSKGNQTEKQLDYHTQQQGVEGNTQGLVDDLEPPRARNGTVTRERPGAAGIRRHASDTTAHTEEKDGYAQAESTGAVAGGRQEDSGNGVAQFGQRTGIRKNERNGDNVGETGNHVHDDSTDNRVGDLDGGSANLFTHPTKLAGSK